MLIESGHYFLVFSIFLLFTQSSFFLALSTVALAISLLCLFISYACSDFSVINVFLNSNHQLPIFYKISGAWSNHEGSMLLWAWINSLFCILFLVRSRLSAQAIQIRPQFVLSCVLLYFCIFLFATSNPYLRLFLISPEAMAELNPVLQDPILAIHPPLIYAGYVASAIGFAVCLCICIKSYTTENGRSLGQKSHQRAKWETQVSRPFLQSHVFSDRTQCIARGAQAVSPFAMRLLGLEKCQNVWSEPRQSTIYKSIERRDTSVFSFIRSNKAHFLSGYNTQDLTVSGLALSVIRTIQDWGWREIRIWTLICWCFLTVGILLGSWWAYHELGWGGWWFWDPVENASFMPWVLSTGLAHSILYARLRLWTVFFTFAIFLLSLLGTFFVRSGLLASVHSFASDSSRGVFFFIFLIGLLIICTLAFYQFQKAEKKPVEQEIKERMTQAAQRKKKANRVFSFTAIQSLFALIVCAVVLCGTAAPVLFSLILERDVSAGAPFFNGTIIPISGALLILCIFAQLNSRSIMGLCSHISFLNFLFFLFLFVLNTALAFFIGGLPITESLFFSIAFLLFQTLLWKSRTSMQLAHGGLCAFIAGIILSNPYKSQATQMLQIGDLFFIDKNTLLILRGIDQLYGPTFQSICANLFVQPNQTNSQTIDLIQNNNAFAMFPEKRFYYLQTDSSTTKVAVQTNGLSDVYALIGTGNFETGWYTTVIKLPFIACIWIGFFVSSLGGFFSLWKQLKTSSLCWV